MIQAEVIQAWQRLGGFSGDGVGGRVGAPGASLCCALREGSGDHGGLSREGQGQVWAPESSFCLPRQGGQAGGARVGVAENPWDRLWG